MANNFQFLIPKWTGFWGKHSTSWWAFVSSLAHGGKGRTFWTICTGLVSLLLWQCKQWGSEIWISLDLEWDLKSGAQPFEIQKNCSNKKHLKSGQKCLDFEWFGFQMVGTIALTNATAWPFENQTVLNPILKMSIFQMFLDFELSDFRSPL